MVFLSLFFSSKSVFAAASEFQYTLLEGLPGFFNAGGVMTDFPSLVLAIYKFGIWTIGISGLFMITIGGIMYTGSAGNTSTAETAKGLVTDSLIGIAAAMIAYLFLYVINPDLTQININFVPVNIDAEVEDIQVNGSVSTSLVNIAGINETQIDSSFAVVLAKLKQKGISTIVTAGLRSVEKQVALITKNCGNYPPVRTCSPATCLLKNGPASCPHTTGKAADIWALNSSGGQALSQKQCMNNITACFNDPYQKALISAMRAEGFCVLSSEPWHFEKPRMSSTCS